MAEEELKFQKLGAVELLEEAPEGAHALVESDGSVFRVKGGIGGGAGVYIVDVTDVLATYFLGTDDTISYDEDTHMLSWSMPAAEAYAHFDKIRAAGMVSVLADLTAFMAAEGAEAAGYAIASGTTTMAMWARGEMSAFMIQVMLLPDVPALSITGGPDDPYMSASAYVQFN